MKVNRIRIGGALAIVLAVSTVAQGHFKTIPETLVLVNQVGYDVEGLKRFLLQSKKALPEEAMTFDVLDLDGKTVFAGRFGPVVQFDWAPNMRTWYRRGEFTAFREPGVYRVVLQSNGRRHESYPFQIGDKVIIRETASLVAKFFYAWRCGGKNHLHSGCHLKDAILPDGTHRDLTGGWHDAGNHPKMCRSCGVSAYGLARFAAGPANRLFVPAGKGFPSALDEAVWGGTYLLKLQDPKTGRLMGNIDFRPSKLPKKFLDAYQSRRFEGYIAPGEWTYQRFVHGGVPKIYRFDVYEISAGTGPLELSLSAVGGALPPLVCVKEPEGVDTRVHLKDDPVGEIKTGAPVFTDRAYTLTSVPGEMTGAVCVRTMNDLKDQQTDGGVAFSLSRPADVFVAMEASVASLPKWPEENGFQKISTPLMLKGKVSGGWGRRLDKKWRYQVYRKAFPAGLVRLGANHGRGYEGKSGNCMYIVGVKEKAAAKDPLIKSVGFRLSAISARPEARLYLPRDPKLRGVSGFLEGATFFQGRNQWRTPVAGMSVHAPQGRSLYLCVDRHDKTLPARLLAAGFKKSDEHIELWSHRFLSGGWGGNFTRSNGFAVAALASLYRATGEEKYLTRALQLWETMRKDPSDAGGDTAILAADNELYRTRKEQRFVTDAVRRIERIFSVQPQLHDNFRAAVMADHLLAVPDSPKTDAIRKALKEFGDWTKGLSQNVFQVRRYKQRRFFPTIRGNTIHVGLARALLLRERVLGPDKELREIARASIDWMLGLNPYGVCLIAGAGSKHLMRYLGYFQPHEVPGSITNGGICAGSSKTDEPYLDMRPLGKKRCRGDGQTSEPVIDTAGIWMMVLTEMAE